MWLNALLVELLGDFAERFPSSPSTLAGQNEDEDYDDCKKTKRWQWFIIHNCHDFYKLETVKKQRWQWWHYHDFDKLETVKKQKDDNRHQNSKILSSGWLPDMCPIELDSELNHYYNKLIKKLNLYLNLILSPGWLPDKCPIASRWTFRKISYGWNTVVIWDWGWDGMG